MAAQQTVSTKMNEVTKMSETGGGDGGNNAVVE